jgi:hypothetical protein
MLPNQAIASTPSAPRPSGAEGRGSTAPLCLQLLRTSQARTTYSAILLEITRHYVQWSLWRVEAAKERCAADGLAEVCAHPLVQVWCGCLRCVWNNWAVQVAHPAVGGTAESDMVANDACKNSTLITAATAAAAPLQHQACLPE